LRVLGGHPGRLFVLVRKRLCERRRLPDYLRETSGCEASHERRRSWPVEQSKATKDRMSDAAKLQLGML